MPYLSLYFQISNITSAASQRNAFLNKIMQKIRTSEPEPMTNSCKLIVIGFYLASISGCTPQPAIKPEDMTLCSNPRPEVCTMEYDPVCGYSVNDESRNYASACSACSDITVIGYLPGECQ
jgi:hypothetical protein